MVWLPTYEPTVLANYTEHLVTFRKQQLLPAAPTADEAPFLDALDALADALDARLTAVARQDEDVDYRAQRRVLDRGLDLLLAPRWVPTAYRQSWRLFLTSLAPQADPWRTEGLRLSEHRYAARYVDAAWALVVVRLEHSLHAATCGACAYLPDGACAEQAALGQATQDAATRLETVVATQLPKTYLSDQFSSWYGNLLAEPELAGTP